MALTSESCVNAEPQSTRRLIVDYEMLEQVGEGGMAVVYKARQRSLNRSVAIKLLRRSARTEEFLARFDREANIVARLNHPNIVQVFDQGQEGESLFIIMEFVNGESLERLIADGKLSIGQTHDYALQICDALDYAHSKGVIHRDLKPSNILVDQESGRAKICDFGIATTETSNSAPSKLTTDDVLLGTINYMSPEQRLGTHTLTLHTDLFSFGVVLYEMLTGKLPLGHFKLPSSINPQVPAAFDQIVRKCMAQSPADRYQSAGAVKADLGRISGRYLKPQRKTSPFPTSRWSGRRNFVIGGIGVLAIALTAALVLHAHRGRTAFGAGDPIAAEYKHAQELIAQNRSGEAIGLLKDVQVNGPRRLAANAQFDLCRAYDDIKDYRQALTEYDVFLRCYPKSPQAPEALMDKYTLTWKTMPTSGTFFTQYYEGSQRELVKELQKLIADYPKSDQATKALHLIADVCDKPGLNDWKTEADALVALFERDPVSSRDLLYKAAGLYADKTNDKALADKTYERFLNDFPDDSRRSAVERARMLLNNRPDR